MNYENILAIEENMNKRTLECTSEIEAVIAALCTSEHCVLIGPPGTGKSRIVDDACYYLGGLQVFKSLLHRYIPPEEIVGPISIKALTEKDEYRRITKGKLPEADVAYLDEIFNTSSAFLNTLLNMLNERTFFDGDKQIRIPLRSVIASSNQLPEGLDSVAPDVQTSRAIYDRILLRCKVQPLQGDRSWVVMVTGNVDIPREPSLVLDKSELDVIQSQIAQVSPSRPTIEALLRMRSSCIRDGIMVSDRRWRKCMNLARFKAWKSGRKVTEPKDLLILTNVLWTSPDQISKTMDAVFACAVPAMAIARKLEGKYVEQVQHLRNTPMTDDAYLQKAIELNKGLLKAKAEIKILMEKNGSIGEVQRIYDWMQGTQQEMALEIRRRTNPGESVEDSLGSLLRDLEKNGKGSDRQIGFS